MRRRWGRRAKRWRSTGKRYAQESGTEAPSRTKRASPCRCAPATGASDAKGVVDAISLWMKVVQTRRVRLPN